MEYIPSLNIDWTSDIMNNPITIFTIGFTKKTARGFFSSLINHSVETILDTRLNNTGQLAGFSKKADLDYFSNEILGKQYTHWLDAAPTDDILTAFKKKQISWETYSEEYLSLLKIRRVAENINPKQLHLSCLLCSEHSPRYCHRRILAEYLKDHFKDVTILHL